MVSRRRHSQRGSILLWVSVFLMGMASLLQALNLYLSGYAETAEYVEQEMAWVLCKDGLDEALLNYSTSGAGAFPSPAAAGTYKRPWGWAGPAGFGVRMVWQAETNSRHFPDNLGRLKCEARTMRGSTLNVYATLYGDWEYSTYTATTQWRVRFYPHSFRTTRL